MDLYEKKQLRYRHIFITVLVACIVAVASSAVTYYLYGGRSVTISLLDKASVDEDSTSAETIDAIADSLTSFRTLIDMYYIGEIDETALLDSTIKGYVDGLGDEYSTYMTAEEWEEYQESALGNYVGIGIYMSVNDDGNVEVAMPISGSPAEAAGMKTGDVIVEVDGESVIGVDSSLVAAKIKGDEGTTVHIKAIRDSEYVEFDIIRQEIKIYHVESEMKTDNIGYIYLYTFDEGCAEEVKTAIEDLESQGATKLIFDLRYNTGGLVDEALTIANYFIDKGETLLITVGTDEEETVTVADEEKLTDMELVVLANEYSASASEILVGALKDNDRATIVGTTTYGKGVIQNVFSLTDGSVLKLTIAEYFTPKNNVINKVGIEPDYEVELEEDENEETVDTQLNKALELLGE